MKKLIPVLLLAAVFSATSVFAQERVYVTKSGKHYHVYRSCSSLKKAKDVSSLQATTAKSRKMNMCELCKAAKRKASQKSKTASRKP